MRSLPLQILGKILRILLYCSTAGYFSACLYLYFNQERFIFFPTVLPRDFVYPFTHPYSEVFLPVDGAVLALVHFTQPNPKGVVLYLHGNAENLASAEAVAERFIQRGYAVVLLDYRGYGKSTGSITNEATLHQDAQAVYAYVQQHYREDQIVVYGQSLGTGLAVRLAATTAPRMLILESPYLSMQDLVAQKQPYIPLLLLKYPLRSDEWLGKVRCPLYLFHGTDDWLIPHNSSERLQHYSTVPTQLISIAGGGHSNLVNFAPYQASLDRMLR